jgi:hypothetical protein
LVGGSSRPGAAAIVSVVLTRAQPVTVFEEQQQPDVDSEALGAFLFDEGGMSDARRVDVDVFLYLPVASCNAMSPH